MGCTILARMAEASPILAETSARRALTLLCLLGALPFLVLACFGTPFADDFLLANTVREYGVLGNVDHWYHRYTGRFAGIYLFGVAVDAGIMQAGYWMLPFGSLLAFWGSLSCFLRAQPLLPMRMHESVVAAAAGTAIYVVTMPSFVEGMCWLNGVVAYHSGIVAMLVLLAVILSSKGGEQVGLADTGGSARPLNARGGDATTGSVIARAVTCVLLALSIPGFNETAMLATGLFLLIGGMATFRRNRAMCALFAVSLVALAVGGAVNVLAPGNYNRMADLPEAKNLGRSLSRGIGMTFAFFFRWLANPAAIGVTLLVLPGIAARVKDVTLPWPRRRVLTVIVLATIALFFSVLFLGYWAKGQNAPRRVQNVLYFVQLLSWFAFVIMAVAGRPAIAWPAWMSAHRVKVGVLLLAIGVFGVSRWPAAMMDLWHLRGHLDEIAERDRLIAQQMNAEQFDLVIPADSRELRTLCYPAMKVDDPAWVMESYAQWLGARSVKVVPRAEAPQ